ncbi:PPE domain-containing protein [Nocardia uniformis]|uniref:PPE domain-containing protein n=1 Tax=Nocardia uniformis TaxID=53432 RepID=A0A849C0W6_9NOCA|nr:PPE domain-containing protein [Nocardia uniformis]NNH69487.1 PPE domain-containing protein [Nocardia uniformis]
MDLDVDPAELVAAAADLADMVRATGAQMPAEWVTPAGADPVSAQLVPLLNSQAAQLFNGMQGLLSVLARLAYDVGEAAVQYADSDSANAARIDGSSGEWVVNPAGLLEGLPERVAPMMTFPDPSAAADPLALAQQLYTGPGSAAPTRFADSVRAFNAGPSADAGRRVSAAVDVLTGWTPVGSQAASQLGHYKGWLDSIGRGMDRLAGQVDAYSGAFQIAKDKHPTPGEILAARKRLVSAIRSKDESAIAAAMADYEEKNLRSAESLGSFESSAAASQAAAEAGDSEGDASMLQSLLPTLMSALAQGGSMVEQQLTEPQYDDYYDDYPSFLDYGGTPGIPGSAPGGAPSLSNSQYALGPMPMSAAPAASNAGTGTPRVPVVQAAGSAGSSSGMPMGRGGMMPMMPMGGMGAPGAGGAGGGGDRARVVAWHPDQLMYVDDTPHTESVIGERPVIAPTVTPPTPAPANPSQAQSGGNT